MRVGIVSPPWLPVPPVAYGGSEVIVDCLARGLVEAGHEVVLVAPGDSTCAVPTIASPVRSDPARMGSEIVALAHAVRAYAALAEAEVDVIHDHTLAGVVYRHRPAALPVVATHHGPFDDEARSVFGVAAADTAIVAISRDQAQTAAPVPITRVVHHGIDIDAIPVGRGDGGYVLFLGRMNPHKGVREAVLAAREVGVPLKIAARVAEQGEFDYYRDEVAPLIGGDVEFLGEVTGAEKIALLGGACALLNPLRWHEPFGLVMIESLASGTPVIASDAGAVPEVIRDGVTGRVCAEPAALVEALRAHLGDLTVLDRGVCREEAKTRFDLARMVGEYVEVYEELLT